MNGIAEPVVPETYQFRGGRVHPKSVLVAIPYPMQKSMRPHPLCFGIEISLFFMKEALII
jgi:hypothetical protein